MIFNMVVLMAGALLFAAGLHALMQHRYGQRDYRPELQNGARFLSIARWILLAIAIVTTTVLLADGRGDLASNVMLAWIIISLVMWIASRTLRRWGTEA